MESDSRMVVAKVWGGKNKELVFNRYRGSVLKDEKHLEMDGGDGYTTA